MGRETASSEEKSIFDVLGLKLREEKRLRREFQKESVTEWLIKGTRETEQLLQDVDEELTSFTQEFRGNPGMKTDPDAREELQMVYELKLLLLATLARRLHPLSEYGRERLLMVQQCRKEYDALAGPLLTMLSASNVNAFSGVLSADQREEIAVGKYRGLGAIRYRDGRQFGVGAITYYLDRSPVSEQPVLRINGLFVHPDFRERGVASHLIAELVGSAAREGVEIFNMALPIEEEGDSLLAYVMKSWHFVPELGITTDAVFTGEDLLSSGNVKKTGEKALPFLALPGGMGSPLLKRTLNRLECPDYLLGAAPSDGYIDPFLSSFVGDEQKMLAILLAHRLPSGILRVEFLDCLPGENQALQQVICRFIQQVISEYGKEALMVIPVDFPDIEDFIGEILDVQRGQYLLDGLLTPLLYGEDPGKAVMTKMLSLSEDEGELLIKSISGDRS